MSPESQDPRIQEVFEEVCISLCVYPPLSVDDLPVLISTDRTRLTEKTCTNYQVSCVGDDTLASAFCHQRTYRKLYSQDTHMGPSLIGFLCDERRPHTCSRADSCVPEACMNRDDHTKREMHRSVAVPLDVPLVVV